MIGGNMIKAISASERINENVMVSQIRRAWSLFYRDGSVVEVRIFLHKSRNSSLWMGFGDILSGYFDNADTLINLITAIEKSASPQATYITINPVDVRLASRAYNRFIASKRGDGASDNEVTRRSWLMIDLDPIRPKKIMADTAEVNAAMERSALIQNALKARGWPEPVVMFSGNGYHLFYQIMMGNTDVSRELISAVLNSLQLQFGDKELKTDLGSEVSEGQIGVKLDTGVFNAGRITKLYGTWARLGDEIGERQHRQSYIEFIPDEILPVPAALLDAEAEIYRSYQREVEADKRKARPAASGGNETIIERFKREHPITDIMEAHGYTHAHGDRYNHPNNGDGCSVLVLHDIGKTKHFSTNDPMHNGHSRDAFDYEVFFNFGGDEGAAIKHWAKQYGVHLNGAGAKHTNGKVPHYVNYQVESSKVAAEPAPPPAEVIEVEQTQIVKVEPAPAPIQVIGSGEIVKLTFEAFVEKMRLRVTEVYDREFAISCLRDNDNGNARLLSSVLKGFVVHDHVEKAWYWYNNLYWMLDNKADIDYLASEVLKYYYDLLSTRVAAELKRLEEQSAEKFDSEAAEKRRNLLMYLQSVAEDAYKRSKALCNVTPVHNCLAFAKAGERLGISGEEWDQDMNQLGCQNAIIDLKERKPIRPFPTQYIRTVVNVVYDPACSRELWEKTVMEVLDYNVEKYDYIKRQLGYAMSGLAVESDFYVWYGRDGRNGKELILNLICDVLGEKLAGVFEVEHLLVGSIPNKNGASEQKMTLRGRRIAWASETSVGRTFDVGAMKDFSGGMRMQARGNNQKQVQWKRTHTLFLLTNHLPHINSDSDSEWERIKRLDFPFTYVENPDPDKPWQKKKDATLTKRIAEKELPGILNWLIEGYAEYLEKGLATPDAVRKATSEYREAEDSLGFFISECCVLNSLASIERQDLYNVYLAHMGREKPLGKKKFYELIRNSKRGITEKGQYFFGIGLKAE